MKPIVFQLLAIAILCVGCGYVINQYENIDDGQYAAEFRATDFEGDQE